MAIVSNQACIIRFGHPTTDEVGAVQGPAPWIHLHLNADGMKYIVSPRIVAKRPINNDLIWQMLQLRNQPLVIPQILASWHHPGEFP